MSRFIRIVPTTILTTAALALAVPAAQAMPTSSAGGGGSSLGSSPLATSAARDLPTRGPIGYSGLNRGVGVNVARDFPRKTPVQLPETLGQGLIHSTTVQAQVGSTHRGTPISNSNGFDWTAAGIGAATGCALVMLLAVGAVIRRRGQLAT